MEGGQREGGKEREKEKERERRRRQRRRRERGRGTGRGQSSSLCVPWRRAKKFSYASEGNTKYALAESIGVDAGIQHREKKGAQQHEGYGMNL